MATINHSPTLLKDFFGRRITASAIFIAGLGSASLNVYGATQIFPQWQTAAIFATVVSAGEAIAFLSLRNIMADFENNRYWKARLGSLILVLAIAGCVISGHRAFHTLNLEATAKHDSLAIRAVARQQEANAYHEKMLAGQLTDISPDMAKARWERMQELADDAKLAEMKSKPIPEGLVYVFLALFEVVKIGGLWALATPTTKGLTKAQRTALKRQAKIREAKALADFERKLAEAEGTDEEPGLKLVKA